MSKTRGSKEWALPHTRSLQDAPSTVFRLPTVAVIGANAKTLYSWAALRRDKLESVANDFGRWLAAEEAHLLTGGGMGIMAAVAKGFVSRPARTGHSIGIVPKDCEKQGYPNPWIELPIRTHLPTGKGADSRNPIIARTASLIVAFPGGEGTANELQLALDLNTPVIVYDDADPSNPVVKLAKSASGKKRRVSIVKSEADLRHAVIRGWSEITAAEPRLTKRIQISFQSNGEGSLSAGGNTYKCLGQMGRPYPVDMTVSESDKEKQHYSQQYQVMMYWAILIWGQKGIYIHEGPDTLADNGGDSAGCIHLGPHNAETVFNWVDGPTRVTIDYPW